MTTPQRCASSPGPSLPCRTFPPPQRTRSGPSTPHSVTVTPPDSSALSPIRAPTCGLLIPTSRTASPTSTATPTSDARASSVSALRAGSNSRRVKWTSRKNPSRLTIQPTRPGDKIFGHRRCREQEASSGGRRDRAAWAVPRVPVAALPSPRAGADVRPPLLSPSVRPLPELRPLEELSRVPATAGHTFLVRPQSLHPSCCGCGHRDAVAPREGQASAVACRLLFSGCDAAPAGHRRMAGFSGSLSARR
jgi:hypothetical protein